MTFAGLMTDQEWRDRRLKFSLGEIAELNTRIAHAPPSDLWRCASRVAAAHRLGCFNDATHADFLQRLEIRRAQLGLADACTPYPPPPKRAA